MKRLKFILSFALVALIAVTVLTGCDGNSGGDTPYSPSTQEESQPTHAHEGAQDIGEGETVFRFEVTDDNGEVSAWNVHTDETTVGAALLEVGLIAGDEADFGLMVTEVNGLTADFAADGAFWAFYIDGEFAMTGVDATNITPDTVYAFVYTAE